MSQQKKPNNLKTALILASIALAFFVGLFVKRIWFG
ncbi:cytochrome oxidase small assembly protein [Noviherbaspirillum massiliense]|nr:cytochrome oxidase small assembly protein [Noviherbaspirillum massiliense]